MAFVESSSLARQSDLTSDPKARFAAPEPYISVNGILTAESDRVALKQADRIWYRVDKEDDTGRSASADSSASSSSLLSRNSKPEKQHGKVRQWFEKFRYQGELEFYLQPTK